MSSKSEQVSSSVVRLLLATAVADFTFTTWWNGNSRLVTRLRAQVEARRTARDAR